MNNEYLLYQREIPNSANATAFQQYIQQKFVIEKDFLAKKNFKCQMKVEKVFYFFLQFLAHLLVSFYKLLPRKVLTIPRNLIKTAVLFCIFSHQKLFRHLCTYFFLSILTVIQASKEQLWAKIDQDFFVIRVTMVFIFMF